MTNDKKDFSDLSDLANSNLSVWEVHNIATNLNRIEAQRELQKNPTTIDYIYYIVILIAAIPVGFLCLLTMIESSGSFIASVFATLICLVALYADICFIRYYWKQMTGQ
mgnify:CR=1 FL=1